MHPGPMSTLSKSPLPLSSVTVRHRFPSAVRVNVMPVLPLPTVLPLSSPSSETAPVLPVRLLVDELPEDLCSRRASETRVLVEGPATEAPVDVAPVPGPAAGPPVEDDVCGADAVCGAGMALFDGWPVDDSVAEAEAGVDGAVVLFVSVSAAPVGLETGALAATDWTDCRTASDGFEPPLPLGATVVLGACCAGVLVADAAVVGGVAGATVVGVLPPSVPWAPVWVPEAVWAEAGPAFSTRKSPVRSARDAAHLRGLTTSILELLLIGLKRPPWLHCEREGRTAFAGTREVNHDPGPPAIPLLGR